MENFWTICGPIIIGTIIGIIVFRTTNNYNTVGLNIEGKRLKIINTILKSIYERENQELSVKEIIDISHNIIDNFFGRNGLEKINKNLIVSGKLEKEFI